jgi:hypothetical protein
MLLEFPRWQGRTGIADLPLSVDSASDNILPGHRGKVCKIC